MDSRVFPPGKDTIPENQGLRMLSRQHYRNFTKLLAPKTRDLFCKCVGAGLCSAPTARFLSSPEIFPCYLLLKAIPHNSKCRYGERGAAAAKPKAQIILDAAKVSAASGGYSEPKQGQRSQSARGFCPRSTMRVPQPDIIEHFGNADAVPQQQDTKVPFPCSTISARTFLQNSGRKPEKR